LERKRLTTKPVRQTEVICENPRARKKQKRDLNSSEALINPTTVDASPTSGLSGKGKRFKWCVWTAVDGLPLVIKIYNDRFKAGNSIVVSDKELSL